MDTKAAPSVQVGIKSRVGELACMDVDKFLEGKKLGSLAACTILLAIEMRPAFNV